MMNYFFLARFYMYICIYLFNFCYSLYILKLSRYFTLTNILSNFSFSKVLSAIFFFRKINTKITLVLINSPIIYLLFIRNPIIHRENLTMHAFITYSHWSLGLIFSFSQICGYHTIPMIILDHQFLFLINSDWLRLQFPTHCPTL